MCFFADGRWHSMESLSFAGSPSPPKIQNSPSSTRESSPLLVLRLRLVSSHTLLSLVRFITLFGLGLASIYPNKGEFGPVLTILLPWSCSPLPDFACFYLANAGWIRTSALLVRHPCCQSFFFSHVLVCKRSLLSIA